MILKLDGRTRQTEFIKNQKNPIWNAAFEWDFPIKEDLKSKVLEANIYDHDIGKKDGTLSGKYKKHAPLTLSLNERDFKNRMDR